MDLIVNQFLNQYFDTYFENDNKYQFNELTRNKRVI